MKLSAPRRESALLRNASSAAVNAGVLMLIVCSAQAQQGAPSVCGELGHALDFQVDKDRAKGSEGFHFTPEVELLIRGKSTEQIGGDIHFMLTNFPNHHRALLAMMRLGEKEKTPQPRGAGYSVECYFDRALRFRPNDSVARMLYATYLQKNGRQADARAQLEVVTKAAAENPFTQYNAGLIYLEMKDYGRALEQAHKADALGFNRPELKDRLKIAGRWKEPLPAVPESGQNSNAAAVPGKPASAGD